MGRWRTLQFEFSAMAAPCSIVVDTRDETMARGAAKSAIAEVHRIEEKYSRYSPDSVLSRINRNAGQAAQAIDPETAQLLGFADSLWRLSDGCFDITSGVLRQVWDFKGASVPSAAALQAALMRVGWPGVEYGGTSVRFARDGMEIDFGGIGKEYAADRAAVVLRQHGVNNHALVNLGGDIHALGPRAGDHFAPRPWSIAIRHPRDRSATLADLPLVSGGMATSGDYERYFEIDGRRYCHILDPRSGMPVTHWRSISVWSLNTTTAGALSTIAMLKGAEALAWLEGQGASYLAVRHDAEVFSGDGANPTERASA